MSSAVAPGQRHRFNKRCPICGGRDEDSRGNGKRCHGFTSEDGEWVHCSREDKAGALSPRDTGLYVHYMLGLCDCGVKHGPSKPSGLGEPVATYDYRNDVGDLVYQVLRFAPKTFRQRTATGEWKLNGVQRLLYRLPDLIAAPADSRVFIAEGEKDVEALIRHGLVATCNSGGASSWKPVADQARAVLMGRYVTVIADSDAEGRKWAKQVAESIKGSAASVGVIECPGTKDASEFFMAGGTAGQLLDIAHRAPEFGALPPLDPLAGLRYLKPLACTGRALLLELAAKEIEYIWQDIAVSGTIVLLAGAPGEGKTTLLFLILAARASLGEPVELLGRSLAPAPKGKWIVIIEGEHSEASASRKLVKSLQLLGVDDQALARIILVARKAVVIGSEAWKDVETMVRAGLVSDIALDTIARVAPSDPDKEREQVALFDGIAKLIEQSPGDSKPLVWGAVHLRKNNQSGDVTDISGSAQRAGQADSILMLRAERMGGEVVSSKVVFAKLREDPDDYPKPVNFAVKKVAWRSYKLEQAMDSLADGRPVEERITEQLTLGPRTKSYLADKLHRSRNDIDEAISNLFSARSIRSTTVTVNGRTFKAFELKKSVSSDAEVSETSEELWNDIESN